MNNSHWKTTLLFTICLIPLALDAQVKIEKEQFNYREFAIELTLKNNGQRPVKVTDIGMDYRAFSRSNIYHFAPPDYDPIHVKPVAKYQLKLSWGKKEKVFNIANPSVILQPRTSTMLSIGIEITLPVENRIHYLHHTLQAQPIVITNFQDTIYFRKVHLENEDFINYDKKVIPSNPELISFLNSINAEDRQRTATYLTKSTLDTAFVTAAYSQLMSDSSANVRKAALPFVAQLNYRHLQPQLIANFIKTPDSQEAEWSIDLLEQWDYPEIETLLLGRFDTVKNHGILLFIAKKIIDKYQQPNLIDLARSKLAMEIESIEKSSLFLGYATTLSKLNSPGVFSTVRQRFEALTEPFIIWSTLDWLNQYARDSIASLGNSFQNKLELFADSLPANNSFRSFVIQDLSELLIELRYTPALPTFYMYLTNTNLRSSEYRAIAEGIINLQNDQTPFYIDSLLNKHQAWACAPDDVKRECYQRLLGLSVSQLYTESIPLIKDLLRMPNCQQTQLAIISEINTAKKSTDKREEVKVFASTLVDDIYPLTEVSDSYLKESAVELVGWIAPTGKKLKDLVELSMQDADKRLRITATEIAIERKFYDLAPLMFNNFTQSQSFAEINLNYTVLREFPESDTINLDRLLLEKLIAREESEDWMLHFKNEQLIRFIIEQDKASLNNQAALHLEQFQPCLTNNQDQKCKQNYHYLIKVLVASENSQYLPLIRSFITESGDETYLSIVLKAITDSRSIHPDNTLLSQLKEEILPLLKHQNPEIRQLALDLYCQIEKDEQALITQLQTILKNGTDKDKIVAILWIRDLNLKAMINPLKELHSMESSAEVIEVICLTLRAFDENCD